LNIIEYLFCERLFWQVLLIDQICSRKSVAEKVRQKKCGRHRKIVHKKCSRKSVAGAAEKVWQKKCGRKSAAEKVAEKVRQKNRGNRIVTT
jgi:hypothetical protein